MSVFLEIRQRVVAVAHLDVVGKSGSRGPETISAGSRGLDLASPARHRYGLQQFADGLIAIGQRQALLKVIFRRSRRTHEPCDEADELALFVSLDAEGRGHLVWLRDALDLAGQDWREVLNARTWLMKTGLRGWMPSSVRRLKPFQACPDLGTGLPHDPPLDRFATSERRGICYDSPCSLADEVSSIAELILRTMKLTAEAGKLIRECDRGPLR